MQRRGGRPWVGKITQHGNRYRFSFGDGGGPTFRESYGSKREAETAQKAAIKKAEQDSEITMGQALDKFEQYKLARGNKPAAAAVERARVARFFGPTATDSPLPPEPNPRVAVAMYERLTQSETAKGSRISVAEHQASLKAARRFGAWLVKNSHWRSNPLVGVETVGRARCGESSKAQLSRDQGDMFFAGALACFESGDSAALAALVCLRQGVRVSEIAGRRVSHLDSDGTILRIPSAKSRRGVRDLPIIDSEVRDALREQVKRAREWARGQDPVQMDPPLFPPVRYADHGPHATGDNLSNEQVRRAVHRVCRAVGLPEVTTHSLRGSFASRSSSLGLTLEQVAAFLGNTAGVAGRHYATEQSQTDGAARRAGRSE